MVLHSCNASLNIAAAWVWWCRAVTHCFSALAQNHSSKMRKSRDNVELMILFSLSALWCSGTELLHCSNPEQLTSSLHLSAHEIASVCGALHGSHLEPLRVPSVLGGTCTHAHTHLCTHTHANTHTDTTPVGGGTDANVFFCLQFV